jgi:hypothetical protein
MSAAEAVVPRSVAASARPAESERARFFFICFPYFSEGVRRNSAEADLMWAERMLSVQCYKNITTAWRN